MSRISRTTRVPTLWLYAANDHFFGPALARKMFDAFVAGGATGAEYFAAPPSGKEGHAFIFQDPPVWQPVVAEFLSKLARGDRRRVATAAALPRDAGSGRRPAP